MKKYKYAKTFDDILDALKVYCFGRNTPSCDDCPLKRDDAGTERNCSRFAKEYSDKVAELMGPEVIEVEDKPKITEQELAICKAVGAKWVSRNECNYDNVSLWKIEPTKLANTSPQQYTARNGSLLAAVNVCLFHSLNPGDCVNVDARQNVPTDGAAT